MRKEALAMLHKYLLLFYISIPGVLSAQLQQPKVGIAHTNDVDLSYEVHGSLHASNTVPIIFANGGPGLPRHASRAAAWDELAKHQTIVFYDQRGLGSSRLINPGAAQTLDAQVADVEALRRSLGVEQIIMAGHSWGGNIAMGYAAAYPQHVKKLILIDSARPNWYETPLTTQDSFFPEIMEQIRVLEKHDDNAEVSDEELRLDLDTMFYSDANRQTFGSLIKGVRLNGEIYSANEESMKTVNQWPQVRAMHIPTLIISGRFDAVLPPSTAWDLHKAIAGSKFVVFSKSGHFPFIEEPDRFVSVLNEFVQSGPE
jgi:proline iminopeptidase